MQNDAQVLANITKAIELLTDASFLLGEDCVQADAEFSAGLRNAVAANVREDNALNIRQLVAILKNGTDHLAVALTK